MPETVSRIVEITVFRRGAGSPRYLALQRAQNEQVYPGIWQIVTGTREGTEHPSLCALREVKEETALTAQRIWRLPFVNTFYEPLEDVIHLCPHFAVEVAGGAEPVLSAEHAGYRWCAYEDAQRLLPWSGQRRSVSLVHSIIIPETEESRLLELSPTSSERTRR